MAQKQVPTPIRSQSGLGVRVDDAVAHRRAQEAQARHLVVVPDVTPAQVSEATDPLLGLPDVSFVPTPRPLAIPTSTPLKLDQVVEERVVEEEDFDQAVADAATVVQASRLEVPPASEPSEVRDHPAIHAPQIGAKRYRLTHRGQRVFVGLGFIASVIIGGFVGGVINLVSPPQAETINVNSGSVASDPLNP